MRRILVLVTSILLAGSTLVQLSGPVSAAPSRPNDKNGNKIFDELDRSIKDKSSSHRLEVITLFSGGSSESQIARAKGAIGSFKTIYEYETMPGVAAEMTVG